MDVVTDHAFAAIAPAPYTLVSVVKSADEVKVGRPQVSAICAHCGSHLTNAATFRGADGTEFVVGLDCAKKARESVADHVKAAKTAEILASAPAVMKPYAGLFGGLSQCGTFIRAAYGKPAAKLARAFKPFAKLGMVEIVNIKNSFGQALETRVVFTAAGVGLFGATPGLCRPLVAG